MDDYAVSISTAALIFLSCNYCFFKGFLQNYYCWMMNKCWTKSLMQSWIFFFY